jgi:hypothetical protein
MMLRGSLLLSFPVVVTCGLIPGRYAAFWNAPWPTSCAALPPKLPDWHKWRISTNKDAAFLGETIACIYRAGNFPHFSGMGPGGACANGDWNCTNATATFDGLPQLTNLSEHLAQLERDILQDFPDPNWSGVANIDWEAWKPAFAANRYNEYWIYINRSQALVQQAHPDWPLERVTEQAEVDFNEAARTFWTESLRLCKRLRPRGLWGWYDYPTNGGRYNGLHWLYDEVTALFPSIYLFSRNASFNEEYVDTKLAETRAIRDDIAARTGRPRLPIYSFAQPTNYDAIPSGYYDAESLEVEIARGATRHGLTGVILWGASKDARNATRCGEGAGSEASWIDSTLGPVVLRAAREADACATQRCSGRGRCWGAPGHESCDCDTGWGGPNCTSTLLEKEFVTRHGGELRLGSQRFRFAGTNEYWLGRGEDGPLDRIPSKWAIRDGLLTAAGMGLSVVRSHTVGISTGHTDSFEPSLGVFNEAALDTADYALATAEQLGLRLIVPLTNNGCHVAGCRMDFTGWLGLDNHSAFYTDERAIAAFRAYVKRRLEHVNPYTGRRARDEPAIMAWESGNELTLLDDNKGGPPPTKWTVDLAAYIKSIDPNHLFMDGAYGIANGTLPSDQVDLHSNHYYGGTERLAADAAVCAAAKKPLVIGEYGWNTDAATLRAFFETAEGLDSVVAGTAFWSTFPHSDAGGFVQHGDGFTYHYPGDDPQMVAFGESVRAHAFRMRGVDTPSPIGPPTVPPIVTAVNSTHVNWRGAALAANYSVSIKGSAVGASWRLVCDRCATDNGTPLKIAGGIAAGSSVQVRGYGVTGLASPPSMVWR